MKKKETDKKIKISIKENERSSNDENIETIAEVITIQQSPRKRRSRADQELLYKSIITAFFSLFVFMVTIGIAVYFWLESKE